MKNKKRGLIILVLFLVLSIGIGYAVASSSKVTISGTASATAGDFKIEFDPTSGELSPGKIKNQGDGVVCSGEITDSTTATMTVSGLKRVGDYGQATYTVKNASSSIVADIKATVTSDINDPHYKVTVTGDNTNVDANSSTDINVKVELQKAFATKEAAETKKTFTITVTGTAKE